METVTTVKLEYNSTFLTKAVEGASSIESTLPEYLPDVHRIIRVDARATVTRIKAMNGAFLIEGRIDCIVLYMPSEGNLQSHFVRMPLVIEEANSEIKEGDRIRGNINMSGVTCRPISERKMELICELKGSIGAEETKQCDIISPNFDMDGSLEVMSEHMAFARYAGGMVKEFAIEEMIEMPQGAPDIERMLRCDGEIRAVEYKVVTNRIVMKGEATVTCLYISELETGKIEQYTKRVPFNEVIECEGAKEGDMCSMTFGILDITHGIMEDAMGENRSLSIHIDSIVDANVYSKNDMAVASDVYSSKNEIKAESITVYPENIEQYRCNTQVSDTFNLPNITEIFAVEAFADVKNAMVKNGDPIFKGDLLVSFLVKDINGDITAIDRSTKFESACKSDEGAPIIDATFQGHCAVEAVDYRIGTSGDITVTADIVCSGLGRTKCPKSIISSVQMGPLLAKGEKCSGVTLYYPTTGETAWEVGKRYLVPTGDILLANGIESLNDMPSPLIIPR